MNVGRKVLNLDDIFFWFLEQRAKAGYTKDNMVERKSKLGGTTVWVWDLNTNKETHSDCAWIPLENAEGDPQY